MRYPYATDVEVGGLRFINSGDGPVFDLHDLQKAMHRIKTDGLEPVMEHFVKARIAEIDAANEAKREAAKGKPPAEPVVLEVPGEVPQSEDAESCEDSDARMLFE